MTSRNLFTTATVGGSSLVLLGAAGTARKDLPMTNTGEADPLAPAASDAIRPFRVNVSEAALVDLRRMIAATRWPDRWAERAYPNLIYFNEVDKGGHFAAWEQPEPFATHLRAAFRSVRSGGRAGR
jgi:hypothetical protein